MGKIKILLIVFMGLSCIFMSYAEQPNTKPATKIKKSEKTSQYFTGDPKVEYKTAMKDFFEWREFIQCPINKIVIVDNLTLLMGEGYKPFDLIEIEDPATIAKFVDGMKGAKYHILYGTDRLLQVGTIASFRIIFTSGKRKKTIWVYSFGYSIINAGYLPCMFSSKPLTEAIRETFIKHNYQSSMNWREMATGDSNDLHSYLPSECDEKYVPSKVLGYSGKFGCNYPLYHVAMKKQPNGDMEYIATGNNRASSMSKVCGPEILHMTWYIKLSLTKQKNLFTFLVTYNQSSENPNYYIFRITSPALSVRNNLVVGATGKAEVEKYKWLKNEQKYKLMKKLGSEKIGSILIPNTEYEKIKLPQNIIKLMNDIEKQEVGRLQPAKKAASRF